MRFVGIDLAWSTRANTGVCLVEDGKVTDSALLRTDDDIIAWLAPLVGGSCLVAIDAPLIVKNATGRRPCERTISRCFGRHQAGAHSANLGLPSFAHGVRAERLTRRLELEIDPFLTPRLPMRRAIEVYPHPALVALFGLATSLKYKAKRGRSLADRRLAFAAFARHLEDLRDHDPALDVASSHRWAMLREGIATEPAATLDRIEDEMDAYVCAYVALHYWTHGLSRSRVVGDLESGYIVTPVTEPQAECIDRITIISPVV